MREIKPLDISPRDAEMLGCTVVTGVTKSKAVVLEIQAAAFSIAVLLAVNSHRNRGECTLYIVQPGLTTLLDVVAGEGYDSPLLAQEFEQYLTQPSVPSLS